MLYLKQSQGILIEQGSDAFQRVLNHLRGLRTSSDFAQFLGDFEGFVRHYFSHRGVDILTDVEDIQFTNLDGVTTRLDSYVYLVFNTSHEVPTMVSSPFTSKRACVRYYKELFSDLLPKDFPYEQYLGTFSYLVDE